MGNEKLRLVTSKGLVFIALVIACTMIAWVEPAQAQTFSVIHNFTGGRDGREPLAGLAMDGVGNLYGTAANGGNGYGIVFQLKFTNGVWVLNPLYTFAGGSDGATPLSGVVFGPNGLYGTTGGGGGNGFGTVFYLRPPERVCGSTVCPWVETVLYRFTGGSDGGSPIYGALIFDQAGKIYGTTASGGNICPFSLGCGVVFQLTPSHGSWTENVLYSFTGGYDGAFPYSGVIFDRSGNLYGTANMGGGGECDQGCGTVFELTRSGSGWSENTLHSFEDGSDGAFPLGGLISDQASNLYGTTSGGRYNGGTVFELTPVTGGWTYDLLYDFAGHNQGPAGSLTLDAAGNLYGTTTGDGLYGAGSVFKLSPGTGGWTFTDLYDFTGGGDGGTPTGNVVLGENGILFGTAAVGGASGYGVVWEIIP